MKEVTIYNKMTDAEKKVADVLEQLGIKWTYEHPVFVWDDNKRPRVWAPDFYLISFGVYIEVCGSSDFNYEYRRKILDRNGIMVIFLHLYKDEKRWRYHLMSYLERMIEYKYEKFAEMKRKI